MKDRPSIRRAGAQLASGVDRFVHSMALSNRRRRRPEEALDHQRRVDALAVLAERHRRPRFGTPPGTFFGDAGEPGPWLRTPVRSLSDGHVVDVRWRSGYRPLADEGEVLARLEGEPDNAWGHARLYLHARPRPTAILIHGYLGGQYAIEERAWPLRWMFERLGLDVAIPVLPFHGPRKAGRRPLFPHADPRVNLEAFRQAVHDLIALRRALMERGAPAVGVLGMSLGGYTTALALTADPQLAFGVPFIPLASIADFAREGGSLVGSPAQRAAQHAAIEEAHAPVSPLARPLLGDPARVRVVGGRADQITPLTHARRLADHFDAELRTFHGGHLVQLGRGDAFRDVARMLRDRGLLGGGR